MMRSFKLKLVVYFVLLSLLPVAAAFWGFESVSGQRETRQADSRLQDDLRSALASFQDRLDQAQAKAERLARTRAFQIDLDRRDRPALARLLQKTPGVYVIARGGFRVGPQPGDAASRRVDVVTPHGLADSVVAFLPLDPSLVDSLRRGSVFGSADVLAVLEQGRIVASSPSVRGGLDVPPGGAATVLVGDTRFRVLPAPALAGAAGARFVVLTPQSRIDAAAASSRNRILLGLLVCLLLVASVAFFEGRSIVRTLRTLAEAAHAIARGRLSERVPVHGRDEFARLGAAFNDMAAQLEGRLEELEAERARLRDAVARFGETLAATHDLDHLLRVIAEGAVEATGASGARLDAAGASVESGEADAGAVRLELPIATGGETFGRLALVGERFDEEQRTTAESLASHAAIALENVRLHRLVERQALVDVLTGVANRRACEEALSAEIARAGRLGTPLALVLADLDDFKAVNDLHGHGAGDRLLRTFADVLKETIRGSDVAGRWGGEEFVLLLPGTDGEGATQLADRIRLKLADRTASGAGTPRRVTCSFGVAEYEPGTDADDLFSAADRALYRAKREGKDRVELEPFVRSF
jgi:diguanylate cyclase (GGDEF)-like protein